MKKSLTLAFALVALAVISGFGLAHPQGGTTHPPSLECCNCLGQSTTLDLSTGQGSPIDPLWKMNMGAAYTTPPASPSWCSTFPSPAKWIQPVASPIPSLNVPPGVYKYTVRFYVPKCTIPSVVRLEGKFAADNSAVLGMHLDGPMIAGTSCPGPVCFKCSTAVPFTVAALSQGAWHTLSIDVKNNEGPSGLIVNAKLTRQCARE